VSRVIAWFVHNSVAANLLMALLVVGGLLSLPAIHQEEFPSIETDLVRISVEYRGAAPEEVEQGVCIRIEEEIEGTPGIDRISSMAVEGACVLTVELIVGTDTAAALDEIKNRVDAIATFPVEAETPVVSLVVMTNRVVQLALTGDADERTLVEIGKRVRDEIAALPGVSQVALTFARPYEISIEISEETLRRHELTFDGVTAAVRRWSLDLPGGSVKTVGGEILLRTKGQAYRGADFENVVVLTRTDGTTITLGEIAEVRDGFEDVDLRARLDGRPAALIQVERIGEEDIIAIAERVHSYVASGPTWLPEGVRLEVFDDEAAALGQRLDALLENARNGLVLVLLILGLFLRFRLALWVAAGVPIAFLGGLMFFPAVGLSISTLSVMAFILVLGIVVDDAIVVGESVYTQERRGLDQVAAAIRGTQEVYVPVIFGVMTTVAAFLPLMLVPGPMGRFFGVIGVTAILCLVFSLLESQLILPAHLAHRRTDSRGEHPNRVVALWQRVQGRFGNGLEELGSGRYRRLLGRAIEYRYVVLAGAIGVLLIAAALFASGRLRYQFFPAIEGDIVYASLTMPPGTPVEATEQAVLQIEGAANLLRDEFTSEDGSAVVRVLTTIGNFQTRDGPPDLSVKSGGSHLAEVSLELIPSDERDFGGHAVAQRWRALTGGVTDAVQLVFTADAFSTGKPIDVSLRGGSIETLTAAARAVRIQLAGYPGLSDIGDSFRAGKQELKLSLQPEARPLGLTLRDLASQVRQAFYGEEVQRIQRGRDDVRVMLRYPESERRSLGNLEEMRIRAAGGIEVPFSNVAGADLGRGYSTIRRTDRMRAVNVSAEVDRAVTTPESVLADLERRLPTILEPFGDVSFSLEGEQRMHNEAATGLVRGALLGLLLIYALLAIPLGSYTQPLIIMSVIPFGAVGAVMGHLLMGWDVVFFSVLGIVALSGVVVNASLVLVHYVNSRRAEGTPYVEAVSRAGVARFRPIVLTSATTFAGLVPLMFVQSLQTRMLVPMAISLAFGVLFAAIVTLLLVPCLYVVLEDLKHLRHRRSQHPAEEGHPGTVPMAGG
jgi:multidrug efflux pump subunit AcrB